MSLHFDRPATPVGDPPHRDPVGPTIRGVTAQLAGYATAWAVELISCGE
jgi:hypothetical protein